ncbi:MAG: DUF885 domain-containing protein [Acidimicrobiia bacterium]
MDSPPPNPLPEGGGASPFDRLVDDVFETMWELNPRGPVYLGLHEYDGRVPDWSPGAVEATLATLSRGRAELATLDDLDAGQELDRRQLVAGLDEALFDWETMRHWRRNPMSYVEELGVDLYLKREYAPKAARVARVAEVLEQAPGFLGLARSNLDPVVPRTYCEWGVRIAEGAADFLAQDLMGAVGELEEPGLAARLRDAGEEAEAAYRGYARWIEEELLPRADDSFPIGGESMEKRLREAELVEMSLAELAALGEANLAENLAAFREAAAVLDPSAGPREVYERHVAAVHPTADRLIPATEEMLESIRSFLIERDIITVPSEVRALVDHTPRHLRWVFAMMSTPGPYEKVATQAFYYITPVDPAWDERQAEEWLRALNTFALEDISIHEAYPGHYVHFLHVQQAPTETSRRLASYAFTEGWAHYAEQMMWDEGYREGDLRFRLAQLTEALVRNCRFVCAIAMHTGEMTVDEATRFFMENAYYEETPARKEAERGTFDPGYFSYTLGKLQILRLREDHRKAAGPDYSLKGFHDALLSRGAPPVELMRAVIPA